MKRRIIIILCLVILVLCYVSNIGYCDESKKKKAELVGKWHIKKPDCDNLAKGVKDALEGIAYDNDSQVCHLIITKTYSITPSIEVEICELK